MKFFAHMGVEHGSGQEAALHQSANSVMVIVAVTATVAVLMALAIYLVRRFAAQESTAEDDGEE